MPTTQQEAQAILSICQESQIKPGAFLKLTNDLYQRVGKHSDNWSVRETMRMLYELAYKQVGGMPPHEADKATIELFSACMVPPGPESAPEIPVAQVIEPPPVSSEPAPPEMQMAWYRVWQLIIAFHIFVWIGLVTSSILVFFRQPLSVSFPIISFCVYLITTPNICPVTHWENKVRRKLGWPELKHFTHWYVICPLFHGRQCDRTCHVTHFGPG